MPVLRTRPGRFAALAAAVSVGRGGFARFWSGGMVVLGMLLLSLVFVGCTREAGGKQVVDAAPRVVRLAAVERRAMDRVVVALGSLAAHDQTLLSAKVAGRVQEIRVDLGSEVKAGEVLVVLETQDYELRLRQADALLAQARARLGLASTGDGDEQVKVETTSTVKESFARLEEAKLNQARVLKLSQQGILSASELESSDAQFKVAENQYLEALSEARTRVATLLQRRVEHEIAAQQLADARITAPFDGAVQERIANRGEYLTVGAPVLRLVRLDPLRLKLEVPEREAVNVEVGQVVRLGVSGDDRVYEGKITRISPAINELNRMLVVEADVPRQGGLRPGAFAQARVVTSPAERVVAVDARAVATFAGIEKVFVVEQGKAVERSVVTGRRERGWVEVLSGLKEGEQAVLDPGNLRAGALLRAE